MFKVKNPEQQLQDNFLIAKIDRPPVSLRPAGS
jgi:hypothetical protein